MKSTLRIVILVFTLASTGTGTSGADSLGPSLSPSSLTFASQIVGTTSGAQAVTLTNSSGAPLSISSILAFSVGRNQQPDFAQTNNCGSSLAASSACTINVTFTPTFSGTRTGTLIVTDNASNDPQTASLTGTGTSSGGIVITLATQAGGSYKGRTAVNNVATNSNGITYYPPLVVSAGQLIVAVCGIDASTTAAPSVSDTGGNIFKQVGSNQINGSGGDTVAMFYSTAAHGSSSDIVTCNWGSTTSTVLAAMALVYNGAAATSPVDAYATGSARGGTSISTSAFSTTSPNEVMVAGMMSGSGCIPAPGPGSGYTLELAVQPWGCQAAVAAEEFEVVSTTQSNVKASMTFASPTWADMIVATFKAGSSTGGSPVATLSASSLSFGDQAVETTSQSQSATLLNSGNAPLSISGIAITGTNGGDFGESNGCGTSLAAGASCTISVTFTPAVVGMRTATLTVSDNASGSPQTVSLTGTGENPTGSPPAVVQVQNNIDALTATTYTSFSVPITTNPGDLLVAFCRESSNDTDNFTVTDSAGQAWTQTASGYKNESTAGPRVGMFYVANSAAVTSVTVHFTTSGGVIKPGIMVMELSGMALSGVLESAVTNTSGASVTTSTSGSLTTTNANGILIFATDTASNQYSTGWTAGAGYAIPNNKLAIGASGSNVRMAMQYAIVSSAQANTTTSMTYTNPAWNGNIFAAFK